MLDEVEDFGARANPLLPKVETSILLMHKICRNQSNCTVRRQQIRRMPQGIENNLCIPSSAAAFALTY